MTYAKEIGISPISIWEMSTKASRGRLSLDRELRIWVRHALARPGMRLLEISAEIAITAGELGTHGFHGDPADRLIAATAMQHGAELVTKDDFIRSYAGVRTIW
jgi:PIN domain nuclease of toxin-antitoxin system